MKRGGRRIHLTGILIGALLFFSNTAFAQDQTSSRFIHQIGIEARPGYIFPTNYFLRGLNEKGKAINNAYSGHLRYSFQFQPNSLVDRVYNKPFQGVGLAYNTFNEKESLGNPVALYVFQGARIAQLSPRVSLDYEWNFGLSFGWEPYDETYNSYNVMIGSKTNAYLNASLHLNWMLSRHLNLITGVTVNHYSNGNTNFPNAGLNTIDFRLGLVYNINQPNESFTKPFEFSPTPVFKRHISYDMVLFGSWRRKGVDCEDKKVASPSKYGVAGFNFNPMYNFGYRFRAGLSLDGIYDGSANVYAEEDVYEYDDDGYRIFKKPSLSHQLALGVSGRAEYVMPYFTVGAGLGVNVLHRGGDFRVIYQTLSLKMELTRNSFLHVGYCLHDFHDPSYLMLGIGYRFNNKSPMLHRR